jgi:hypothetical protein
VDCEEDEPSLDPIICVAASELFADNLLRGLIDAPGPGYPKRFWIESETHERVPQNTVRAESALMQGGRSPDGEYEVRIFREPLHDPSDYSIGIYPAGGSEPLYTLDGTGGFLRYPAAVERCRAFWHSSSQFVAVTDQGTRHSRELYLLAVQPHGVERLELPNYIQKALGRVDATEIDSQCVSTPKGWEGDDLLLTLQVSASHPGRGRIYYECNVILHLSHGPMNAPFVRLKSVSQPKNQKE